MLPKIRQKQFGIDPQLAAKLQSGIGRQQIRKFDNIIPVLFKHLLGNLLSFIMQTPVIHMRSHFKRNNVQSR